MENNTEENKVNGVGNMPAGELNDPAFGGFAQPAQPVETNENDFSDEDEKPNLASGVVNNISQKLSETANEQVERTGDEIDSKESVPFDITKLSIEQLEILKSQLNATPDRVSKKKGNPRVFMRRTEDGRFVVKFKRAYLTMMMNEQLQAKEAILVIPVLYYGATEFVDMRWDAFQELEKVSCEVLEDFSKTEEVDDGVTISRETGQEVVMTKTIVRHFFKIKLSDKDIVQVEAEYANA